MVFLFSGTVEDCLLSKDEEDSGLYMVGLDLIANGFERGDGALSKWVNEAWGKVGRGFRVE